MPDMESSYDDPNHWARAYLDYEATRTETTADDEPPPHDPYLAEMDEETATLREALERMGKPA